MVRNKRKYLFRSILSFLVSTSCLPAHCRCTGYCCSWSHPATHTR